MTTKFLRILIYCVCLALSMHNRIGYTQQKPNVLFIAIDDLNDYVSLLQDYPGIHTPTLDQFAQQAVTFTNAHTAAPLCNPSRAALLTGLGPNHTDIYVNGDKVVNSPVALGSTFLPELFKQQGYQTISSGKIFHADLSSTRMGQIWDEEPGTKSYGPQPTSPNIPDSLQRPNWFDYQEWTGPDSDFPDVTNADTIISRLQQTHTQPFFMALGFYRPHNPWTAPKRYFDLYPAADSIEMPPRLPNDLEDVPSRGIQFAGGGADFDQIQASGHYEEVVRAYLASISFMDDQLGRVLDALNNSPYAGNTIVVLFSDHGFHWGEKSHFAKSTLWERATRTLLMIKAPQVSQSGAKYSGPVSLLDIYPTLVDLCSLQAPPQALYGHSLRYVLKDSTVEAQRYALTTIRADMHAVRSDRWRYIDYGDGTGELYDLRCDPHEWNNLWGQPFYADVQQKLSTWLPQGANMPDYAQAQKLPTDSITCTEYFHLFHKSSGQKLHNDPNNGHTPDLEAPSLMGPEVHWKLISIPEDSGYFRLEHQGSNQWFHCQENGVTGFRLGPKSWTGERTKWSLIAVDSLHFRLAHKASGRWLYAEPDGSALQLASTTHTGDQTQWRFAPASSGGSSTSLVNPQDYTIHIWPNPVTDGLLMVSGIHPGDDLMVCDILGHKVYQGQPHQPELALDTSSWGKGIFLVRISSGDQTRTIKVMIQ
ncbi:sulfatase-like hydrolase/transferase [Pontibacter sp. G13]|uniref:sulfatase-like hydrolase/transferase n=1 Tax=Pontibacter sp. G13 TaxID=3074898 RepID=UPI002889D2F3|nr:sulfatase-like hydrolase/transferase [Pontibacter sp. G13]WNJ20649.1 sulfatase-like hydrolase/transferase [Pontibacter sp. G13]